MALHHGDGGHGRLGRLDDGPRLRTNLAALLCARGLSFHSRRRRALHPYGSLRGDAPLAALLPRGPCRRANDRGTGVSPYAGEADGLEVPLAVRAERAVHLARKTSPTLSHTGSRKSGDNRANLSRMLPKALFRPPNRPLS